MPATGDIMYVTIGLHGGGAERLLTNIVLQQRERHRVLVVSLLTGGVFRKTLEDAAVRVTDLGMRGNRDVLRGLFALAALLRARRPAVVYGWMYHANLLAFFALLLAGQPRTRLIWAIFCTECVLPFRLRVILRLSAVLSRWVTGVIYNAEEARRYHHSIGFREPRSVVISNCLDLDRFSFDPRFRATLRNQLGIGSEDVVVVIVGRVTPMKDWDTMRAAVRGLPGVSTIAVGQGTENLPPQERFHGLGWRDDVAAIFSTADIFLLGSAYGEGTSLALAEAMLCGLPCIVTDVGGSAALVGGCGIVVEPRNVAALQTALLELVRDPQRRKALGQAARLRARAIFSREETSRQLELLTFAEA